MKVSRAKLSLGLAFFVLLWGFLLSVSLFGRSYREPSTAHRSVGNISLTAVEQLPPSIPNDFFIYKPTANTNLSGPSVIYTSFGGWDIILHEQKYVWDSIEQIKLLNPDITIILMLLKAGLNTTTRDIVINHASAAQAYVYAYDSESDSLLVKKFQKYFFIPEHNPARNHKLLRYSIERAVALSELGEALQLRDVFHIESDNMVYVNVKEQLQMMYACHIGFAMPVANRGLSIMNFMYFRDAKTMRHFADFVVRMYEMGPAKLKEYIGHDHIHDMSLSHKYLLTNFDVYGWRVDVLPSWLMNAFDRNCLWTSSNVIYDARYIGYRFGGKRNKPFEPFFDPKSPFQEIGNLTLYWKQCEGTERELYCPWLAGRRVVNLHVSSKLLSRFSSKLKPVELPKG